MRIVQALHWLRDQLVREGESDQIQRKLARLFDDPKSGPVLKADLATGMTAPPTWMWEFLKPLVENDAGSDTRHRDRDASLRTRRKPRSAPQKQNIGRDATRKEES